MSDPLFLLRRLFVKAHNSPSASLSTEEFIQNRHFILQILRKLLRKYQVEPKYIIRFLYKQAFTSMFTFRFIDSLFPQDVVYLILLMRIICDIQLQQKNHGERNVSNLSIVEVTLYQNDASVKASFLNVALFMIESFTQWLAN